MDLSLHRPHYNYWETNGTVCTPGHWGGRFAWRLPRSTKVWDRQNTERLPEPHPEEGGLPRPLRPSTSLPYLEPDCCGTPLLDPSSPPGWLGGEYLCQRYTRHTVVLSVMINTACVILESPVYCCTCPLFQSMLCVQWYSWCGHLRLRQEYIIYSWLRYII